VKGDGVADEAFGGGRGGGAYGGGADSVVCGWEEELPCVREGELYP